MVLCVGFYFFFFFKQQCWGTSSQVLRMFCSPVLLLLMPSNVARPSVSLTGWQRRTGVPRQQKAREWFGLCCWASMGSVRSNWAGKFGTGVRCIARDAGRGGVKKEDLWSQTSTGRQTLNVFVIFTCKVLRVFCKAKQKKEAKPRYLCGNEELNYL